MLLLRSKSELAGSCRLDTERIMVAAVAKRSYLNYRQSAWWFFLGWLFGVLQAAVLFRGSGSGSSKSVGDANAAAVRSSPVEAPVIPSRTTVSNPRMEGNGWHAVDVYVGLNASIFHEASRLVHRAHVGVHDQKPWLSQAFQDQAVAALLRNQRNGYFLDLAANDAVFLSNTYSLETNLGWTGLCIEANPLYWLDLARIRNCTVVGAAVGGVTRAVEPIHFNLAGYDSGLVGAGFDQKTLMDNSKMTVFTVPITEVLERYSVPKIIDYMSLDVEGAETFVMVNTSVCALCALCLTRRHPHPLLLCDAPHTYGCGFRLLLIVLSTGKVSIRQVYHKDLDRRTSPAGSQVAAASQRL
jgi:Methyltransferase FkbM domain